MPRNYNPSRYPGSLVSLGPAVDLLRRCLGNVVDWVVPLAYPFFLIFVCCVRGDVVCMWAG